jgi:23S rRNA pseudouridine2605 synthase
MRVQKFLAESGIASRRASEDLIRAGRVTVNGKTAALGACVDPGIDSVCVDGKQVERDTKLYILLNKPRGVITTAKDTHRRRTVLELLEGVPGRVFPVGRLDRDVTGALLLTNDGELANRIAHPRYELTKTYLAWVEGSMRPAEAKQLERGVELEDGVTSPARVRVIKEEDGRSLVRLEVHEGRKHLIKRMCAAVGHPVSSLRRVSVGPLHAEGLRPGEWRYLTPEEVRHLRRAVQMDTPKPERRV